MAEGASQGPHQQPPGSQPSRPPAVRPPARPPLVPTDLAPTIRSRGNATRKPRKREHPEKGQIAFPTAPCLTCGPHRSPLPDWCHNPPLATRSNRNAAGRGSFEHPAPTAKKSVCFGMQVKAWGLSGVEGGRATLACPARAVYCGTGYRYQRGGWGSSQGVGALLTEADYVIVVIADRKGSERSV